MKFHHAAIWTSGLERLKEYYTTYLEGTPGRKYTNPSTGFESYFIFFQNGASLEIMQKPGIPANLNDREKDQHLGLIHLAFELGDMESVIRKCNELKTKGFLILRGPRRTGDGYFEFETLDPDGNRIEVMTVYSKENK